MDRSAILGALGLLKKADPAEVKSILEQDALVKAEGATMLQANEKIDDIWEEGELHRPAERREINVGPSQASRGSNAEKMNREYSDNTAQRGLAAEVDSLKTMYGGMTASMKSISDALGAQATAISALAAAKAAELTKADEMDDEAEYCDKSASAAKSLLEKAQRKLEKAATLKAEAEDMEDEDKDEEAKSARIKAKQFRKSAAQILAKAKLFAFAAKSTEVKVAIKSLIAKSSVEVGDVFKAENDEDEEVKSAAVKAEDNKKEEAEKAAKAAAAKAEDSMQEEWPDSAKAAMKALSGELEIQSITLKGMLDKVAGLSKVTQAPVLVKAVSVEAGDDDEKIASRIEDMLDAGAMTAGEGVAASSLLNQFRLVKSGALKEAEFKGRLDKTSDTVRGIFAA